MSNGCGLLFAYENCNTKVYQCILADSVVYTTYMQWIYRLCVHCTSRCPSQAYILGAEIRTFRGYTMYSNWLCSGCWLYILGGPCLMSDVCSLDMVYVSWDIYQFSVAICYQFAFQMYFFRTYRFF
jgi:hypothetical protein